MLLQGMLQICSRYGTGRSQQGIEQYRGRKSGWPYTMVEEEAVVGVMLKSGGMKQQSNLSCSYWR